MPAVALRPGEHIRLTVRRHPVMIVVPLAVAAGLLVLDFFLIFPLFAVGWFGLILFVALIVFAVAVAFRSWLLWRSTCLLVTDQRVVDVDRTGFFHWTVSDVLFENMADISYETGGPLQTFFRAGDVTVTSVSGSHAIRGTFIPQPGTVREVIIRELRAAGALRDHDRGGLGSASEPSVGDRDAAGETRAARRHAEHLETRQAMKDFLNKKTDGI